MTIALAAAAMILGASPQALQPSAGDHGAVAACPSTADWFVFGKDTHRHFVANPDVPGRSSLRMDIPPPGPDAHIWDTGARRPLGFVRSGNQIEARFWARAQNGGHMVVKLQVDDAPFTAVSETDISLDAQWRVYRVTGRAGPELDGKAVSLVLLMNEQAQTVDLGPSFIFQNTAPAEIEKVTRSMQFASVEDIEIDSSSGVRLAATLLSPPEKPMAPIAIQLTGAGPWGRNSNDPVARALCGKGIAVLQYDKRGVGESTGDFKTATLFDLIADAKSVAAWAKRRPVAVGIIGASQGGTVAGAVAADNSSIKFVISLAGPALPMDQLILLDTENRLKAEGATPQKIADTLLCYRAISSAIRKSTTDDDAVAKVKAALVPFVTLGEMSQADANGTAEALRNPAVRASQLYAPSDDLAKIVAPIMVVYGGQDNQVPAPENEAAAREALSQNPNATVVVVEGANHTFQNPPVASGTPYADGRLLTLVTNWAAHWVHRSPS